MSIDQTHTRNLVLPVLIISLPVCILDDAQRIDPQVCIPKKPRNGYSLYEGLVETMAFERETSLKVLEAVISERNKFFSTPTMAQSKVLRVQIIGKADSAYKPSTWTRALHRHMYEPLWSAFDVDSMARQASTVIICTLVNPRLLICRITSSVRMLGGMEAAM